MAAHRWSRWLEIGAVAGITVLAAWLRLSHLDLAEFKADEATAIELTLPLIEGKAWPEAGLESSVGIRNPPMLLYLLAVPLWLAADPLVAGAFVGVLATIAVLGTYIVVRPRFGVFAAVGAAALFGTAPWAVLLGRKIWAQDLLPVFALGLLACLFTVLERPGSWRALWLPVLVCTLVQLHFSALALLPVVAVTLIYAARQVRWPAVGVGGALAVLMLLPYLRHQAADEWRDLGALAELGQRSAARTILTVHAIAYSANISAARGWAYVTGRSDDAFTASAPRPRRAAAAASLVSALALLVGFLAVAAGILRRSVASRGLTLMDERRALLVVWIGGVWAAFAAARLDQIYPHYLVITYPVSFVLIAIALEDLSRAAARGRPALAASLSAAMVAGLCLTYVAFNLAFFRFVAGQGGTAGDYGVAYRHKAALASFVRDQGIVMMGAPPELEHLVRLGARRAAPSGDPAGVAEPPLRVLVVHDSFRGAFACSPEREVRFGPLLGCLQP